ncbi:hypothetical protein KR044_011827 [Drosophila immigrans]|nr:hypothetical protein KR044_011827 [Drosophila immigrans]
MLTWHLWCTFLCVLWFYFLWSRRKYYKFMFQVPGPWGYPLIGMVHRVLHKEDMFPVFKQYLDKHGTFILSWMGPIPLLFLTDPQLTQDVLNSPHCVNKADVYKIMSETTGEGIFSKPQPLWGLHRKFMNPAFAHKTVLKYLPIFNAETAALLKVMDPMVDSGGKNLVHLMEGLSLNMATQTTMGSVVKNDEYFSSGRLLETLQFLRGNIADTIFNPWLLSKTVRQLLGREEKYAKNKSQMLGFFAKVVIETKLSKGSDNPLQMEDKHIFLNTATELMNRGIFTPEITRKEATILIIAAFETTGNMVAYTLMMLAMFPEYQEKAFEELRSLFPNTGDFEVTYEDTKNMVYMDLIANESMRLFPPIPIIARQAMEDVRLSNGIVIPKGVQIVLDLFHMHRDTKIWGENAEIFNPENFLPHNIQDKHPYAHIPFSRGKRNCIGWRYGILSAKVTLAKLVRNYKFSTSFKYEDLELYEDLFLKLKRIPLLEIQRRD